VKPSTALPASLLLVALLMPASTEATTLFQSGQFGGELYGSLTQHLGIGIHRAGETSKAPFEEPDRRNSRVVSGNRNQTDMPGLHYTYTALNLDMGFWYGDEWKAVVKPFLITDANYTLFDGKRDWRNFEPAEDNLEVDDSPHRIFREAYLQYTHSLIQVRFGQQLVGWGEADGLRLMDVINPIDLTRQAILFDEGYELTRIPETMLRAIVTPGALMLGDTRLFSSWSFEGIVVPQIAVPRVHLAPDGRYGGTGNTGAGGIWSAPPPDYQDRIEILNFTGPVLGPALGRICGFLPDARIFVKGNEPHYQWDNPLLAARFTGEFPSGRVTLNFAQRVGTLSDLPTLGIDALTADLSAPPAQRPGFPLESCPTGVADARLDASLHYRRRNIVGFTVNYDLGDYFTAPAAMGGTSAVLRIEWAYNLRQAFNSAQRVKSELGDADLGTPGSDFQADATNTRYPDFHQRNDYLQYMVGFDWPLRVDFINPVQELFNSFQVFHFRPMFADDKIALQPYKRFLIRENQFYMSFLTFTSYWNRRFIPQILVAADLNAQSFGMKPKMQHEFGDHWRVEWGLFYFNRGHRAPTASIFGLWDRRTDIYTRLTYQF
jgi:hypothetical protein